METRIVYFDKNGDNGLNTISSETFILTSIYMPNSSWQDNYNTVILLRSNLKKEYDFHTNQEMHTEHLLTDKNPYRAYQLVKSVMVNLSAHGIFNEKASHEKYGLVIYPKK